MPHWVDVHVGTQLKMVRLLRGLSQQKVAQLVGVSFQQIQKYEEGRNRISASRLYDFSLVLKVPAARFFDGTERGSGQSMNFSEEEAKFIAAFSRIEAPELRAIFGELITSLAPPE